MSGDIVPFGKYKDKPVEVMLTDAQYTDWCKQQPWLKEKYRNIYNTIINYQAEPTETPEHNKIQMLFLDKGFVAKFLSHIKCERIPEYVKSVKIEFEKRLFNCERTVLRDRIITPPVDVVIGHANSYRPEYISWDAAIEIKPTVGDDFPAIFRQMKESCATELLIGEYTGIGATKEQLLAFFKTAKIRVVFLHELGDY